MSLVFMSYRHKDSDYATRLLFERLKTDLGAGSVFRDVNTTKHGDDFEECIKEAMETCYVFLPVIGEAWLDELNARAREEDYVRLEIETALFRAGQKNAVLKIIPVLLDPAKMPTPSQVPPSIAPICRFFARRIFQGADFDTSYQGLISDISEALPTEIQRKIPRNNLNKSRWASPILIYLTFFLVIITACMTLALSWKPSAQDSTQGAQQNELLLEDLELVTERLRRNRMIPPRESNIQSSSVAALGTPDYSGFEFRSDERGWDLRDYHPERIPKTDETYVSAMVYERTLSVIKKEECQELRLQHRTVGRDIVFNMTSKYPTYVEEATQKNAVGNLRTRIEHLCIDISEAPVNVPFIIHYHAAYWDAYEEESERWMGAMGYPECRQIRMFVISDEVGIFKNLTLKAGFSYDSEVTPCNEGVIVKNEQENAFLWDIQKPTPYKVYMAFF